VTYCPCCTGTGINSHYVTESCHVCAGSGKMTLEVHGDWTSFIFPTEPNKAIEIDELEQTPEIAESIWEWIRETERNTDWWFVHAKYPALGAIEETLLAEGMIEEKEIPGGPNNPSAIKHLLDAKDYQAIINALKSTRTNTKSVISSGEKMNSYKEGLREKLLEELKSEFNTAPVEPKMPKKTVVDKLKLGGKVIAESAKEGAAIGTVTAANKAALDFLEFKLGDNFPAFLKNPAGRAALEMAMPMLVLLACSMDEGNKIPAKQHVELAATYAVKGTSADAMQHAIEFLIQNGGMILMAYTEAGRKLEHTVPVLEETVDFSKLEQELQRVPEAVRVGEKQL
jgi:hypothetical protein